MKRLFFLALALVTIFAGCFSVPAAAKEPPKKIAVLVDGLPVSFDVEPINQNNRILVPYRFIAEALNVEIGWDNKTQTAIAKKGETVVRLQIGSKVAYRNEVPIQLDVPAVIKNNRTLIPMRFFSEAFGCGVSWDNPTNTAKIASPVEDMTVVGFYALGDSRTSSWKNLFGSSYPQVGQDNTDVMSELALGWYSLDSQGNLLTKSRTGWQRPEGWETVLQAAQDYRLKSEMVVHMADGDDSVTALLSSDETLTNAAGQIAGEAKAYQGVNLDIEGLGLKESGQDLLDVQARFTKFVARLSDQLKAQGLHLTLTLHAPNSAYKGYDYKALGTYADRIIIMAYDYGTAPEPVSLVIKAVEMAKAQVPAEKLMLGISLPSETPQSILTKIGIAKRYKLEGIALWRLGLVSDETWNAMRTTVRGAKQ